VLVNNAGNFYAGYFETISPDQFRAQVITVTSLAGLIGQEFVAAYAASKFAREGWMESLRFDVAPFGIQTMAVEPGFFRTEPLVEGA
jgi:NAD(P)-dependent dehydrogenase (short-subunit alcohol dehydrogenase family)